MKKFNFCIVWLKIASILFAVFGAFIALFNQNKIFQLTFSNNINPIFWKYKNIPTETLHFQQWIYGLLGATCIMVGVQIYFIVKNAFEKKQIWAWKCLFISLLMWFIVDTPISFYFKIYFNVIFNFVLLIAVLLPLLITKKSFE